MARVRHTSPDTRIRNIIAKHVAALSQEIAGELSATLLGQFSETADNLTSPLTPTVESGERNLAVSYDSKSRKWGCPYCKTFSDLRRRAVTTHARYCEGPAVVLTPPPPKSRKKKS